MRDLFELYLAYRPISRYEENLQTMSTQEQFFQQFESLFEHYNQALSPSSSTVSQSEAVPREADRLLAAARLAIQEIEANEVGRNVDRRFFAKPGEAEWGC
jgi:hypothetical protein